jgi:hypothetical protein
VIEARDFTGLRAEIRFLSGRQKTAGKTGRRCRMEMAILPVRGAGRRIRTLVRNLLRFAYLLGSKS